MTDALAAPPSAKPKQNKDVYLRAFSRMNYACAREAIEDNELWWCEGLIPMGPGNLVPVNGPGASIAWTVTGETNWPLYVTSFTVSGVVFLFASWSNGNGWVGKTDGTAWTKIANGIFAGQTAAAAWNDQGLLIVDSLGGYYDWNITTAATLTALSESVQSITITDSGSGYATAPSVSFGGPGAGATATAFLGLETAPITAAGAGYLVGDVLTLPMIFAEEVAQVTVSTIGGGGAITAVTISSPGKISVPSGAPIAAFGGAGAGATFTPTYNVVAIDVDVRGSGYSSAPTVTLTGGGFARTAVATANVSGSLTGNCIAVYASRVWIASGRTISFTDAGEYASFIGSGSSFDIEDSYLVGSITVLYAGNNYLYIFGATSIDVLSNVTVNSDGDANFSRVNVSPSVGTTRPRSVFGYYRAVMFANASGFWRLSGATPENISQGHLDLLVPKMFNFSTYGAQITINGVLCACWIVSWVDDDFTLTTRRMLVLYFGGRWWTANQTRGGSALDLQALVSYPVNDVLTAFGFSAVTTLHQLFADSAQTSWFFCTKLWDMGDPMLTKQALRVAIGFTMDSASNLPTPRVRVDYDAVTGTNFSFTNAAGTRYRQIYSSDPVLAQAGKYMGLTVTGLNSSQSHVGRFEWCAMNYKDTTPW